MLALLPATATVVGLSVLGQIPTITELIGVALVVVAVCLHRESVVGDETAQAAVGPRSGAS
jgi:inner membrane transporter RhtA